MVIVLKSTGVVRRIDELGRIVVPKEIRGNLGIRNGDNVEIFIDEDAIVLKKYLKTQNIESMVIKLCSFVYSLFNLSLIVSDREKIIYSPKITELNNIKLDKAIINFIDTRSTYNQETNENFVIGNHSLSGYRYLIPIISNNEALGCIILVKDTKITDYEQNICKLVANIIGDKLDIG